MNKFDENMYKIFRLSLAFEDYLDNTANNIPELDEAYANLSDFRKNKEKFTEEKN